MAAVLNGVQACITESIPHTHLIMWYPRDHQKLNTKIFFFQKGLSCVFIYSHKQSKLLDKICKSISSKVEPQFKVDVYHPEEAHRAFPKYTWSCQRFWP